MEVAAERTKKRSQQSVLILPYQHPGELPPGPGSSRLVSLTPDLARPGCGTPSVPIAPSPAPNPPDSLVTDLHRQSFPLSLTHRSSACVHRGPLTPSSKWRGAHVFPPAPCPTSLRRPPLRPGGLELLATNDALEVLDDELVLFLSGVLAWRQGSAGGRARRARLNLQREVKLKWCYVGKVNLGGVNPPAAQGLSESLRPRAARARDGRGGCGDGEVRSE